MQQSEIVMPDIHFHTSRRFIDTELMYIANAETAGAIVGHSIKMVLESYATTKPQKIDETLQKFSSSIFSHRKND